MALSIKNREVEELARELARLTRKPITEAVRDSLKREVERAKVIALSEPRSGDLTGRIAEIANRYSSRPLNDLTEDEILGYDEFGAPTK